MTRAQNFREAVRSGLLDLSFGPLHGLFRRRRLPTRPRLLPTSFGCRRFLAIMLMAPLVSLLLPVLTASAARVTLTWNRPISGSVAGYKVFHRYAGQGYNYSQPIWQGATTTCTTPDLPNKTTYFVVRAYNAAVQSANSNETIYRPPTISLTSSSLSAGCVKGSNAPNQSFRVSNSGGGVLSYSISDNRSWLACSATSGTSTGEQDTITVKYATSGLAPGIYSGTITIAAPGATNSPKQIAVKLTVTKASTFSMETQTATTSAKSLIPTYMTDGEGMSDSDETGLYGTNPLNADIDRDDIGKVLDPDADSASVPDGEELQDGIEPGGPESKSDLPLEVGRVAADHKWKRITFRDPFADPIVVAGIVTTNDAAPAVVRIRNLDARGFDLRIQEWDYLDGVHALETVGYLVLERGNYVLPDGTRVEAGRFTTNKTGSFLAMPFSQPFPEAPVVLATVVSADEDDTVTTRVRSISTHNFELRMQEQEGNTQSHATETICYLVWEPSSGSVNGMPFETSLTQDAITQVHETVAFRQSFAHPPVVISGMQTTDDSDTATVRCRNLDRFHVDVRIEEERSGDNETVHTNEVVGYVAVQYP